MTVKLRSDNHQTFLHTTTILALTLLAFGLRLTMLDRFSMRGDEAFDVLIASQSLAAIIDQLRTVHPYPPLFYMGFHHWLKMAGSHELAARFAAAGFATVIVPIIYALGRQLFGRRVGLIAALLAVVNPFIQWWGQDTHFFACILALVALLYAAALRFWKSDHPTGVPGGQRPDRLGQTTALYVVVALLCFFTYYFSLFAWGALNLVAVVYTLRGRWSRWLIYHWWGAQLLVILLYLPWLLYSLPFTATFVQPWVNPARPGDILWRTLTAFSLGYTEHFFAWARGAIPWLAGFSAVIFVLGIGLSWKRPALRSAMAVTLTLIFAPLAVIYLASFNRPLYDEKYVIILLPLYLVVLAVGIRELTRRWRPAGQLVGVAVVVLMSFATFQYQFNLNAAKSPDWREALGYVHHQARPGDVIIRNFPEPSVLYYNDGELPVMLIPSNARPSPAQTAAEMERAMAAYDRVWLVPLIRPWWDPDGSTPVWLDRHADRVDQTFFRGVHVALYLTPSSWLSAMTPQPVTLAEGVQLLGFRMADGADGQHLVLSPGDTLHLSLYWQADGRTDTAYTVFTHLAAPDGQVYGQWDNPPVRGTYPTTEWQPGDRIVDQYEIPIDAAAPAGDYQLLVGMYDPVCGARLPVLAGHTTGDAEGTQARDHIVLDQEIAVQ